MDFRIKVFLAVVRHLSFTKASSDLNISQPAISRHIAELESAYSVRLFTRQGNRIALSDEGRIFLRHAELIDQADRALRLDMNLLTDNFKGHLRLGASTTIAQYVLPSVIARFISRYPDIRIEMISGNSRQIEGALLDQQIDLGFVEGDSRRAGLRYSHFMRDELVVVTSALAEASFEELSFAEFMRLPLVLRESGSGTLEVIENILRAHHNVKLSDLNIMLHLGSTEAIKLFLMASSAAYAVVSVVALAEELSSKRLMVVDVAGLDLRREFSFVSLQGSHNELADHFIEFCSITKSYR